MVVVCTCHEEEDYAGFRGKKGIASSFIHEREEKREVPGIALVFDSTFQGEKKKKERMQTFRSEWESSHNSILFVLKLDVASVRRRWIRSRSGPC